MAIEKFQGETRWLSNFQESKVMLDGTLYPTVEHAYQAAKTLDKNERQQIKECDTPGKAKRMGMTVTMRPDWDEAKYIVMFKLVPQKFKLHKELKEKLLATGDEELIEGNTWNDTYWGVCNGVGQNNLGKILMEVRKMLK